MDVLAYHGDDPATRPQRDLDGLGRDQRLLAVVTPANGLLPWPLEALVVSLLDYAMRPSPGRQLRPVMPADGADLIGLAVVMGTLSALSWWSGRLMNSRRWRGVSLAIAALQVWYIPWGTIVAVRAARLLVFRAEIRDLYRRSPHASDHAATIGPAP